MAAEISAVDMHFLIQEMKLLEGARVDRITQSGKEILFSFYLRNTGNVLLKIAAPGEFRISQSKITAPEGMPGFCASLRKHLANAVLSGIEQTGSERIVILHFRKEDEMHLAAELYGQGNVILCDSGMKIISSLNAMRGKHGANAAGKASEYNPPKRKSFFELKQNDISQLEKMQEKSVSKSLAVDFGFGGQYARELCARSGIEENALRASPAQAKQIFASIKELLSSKLNPGIVNAKGALRAVPFRLKIYEGMEFREKESFSAALDEAASSVQKRSTSAREKEIMRLERIAMSQEEKIKELEKSAAENQNAGEKIYESYNLVSEIISEIKKARQKYSWKEIKEKLKAHKIIKEVDESKGSIIIEI